MKKILKVVKKKTKSKSVKNRGKKTVASPSELKGKEKSKANLAPPWEKGQSGNPGGRPPGKSTTALRREDLKRLAKDVPYAKKLCTELGLKSSKATIGDVLAAVANQKAMEEAQYYRENLNRDEGKTPDRLITAEVGPLDDFDDDKLDQIINAGRNRTNAQKEPE